MTEQVAQELGEIKGLLKGMAKQLDNVEQRLEKQDTRLRAVETKSVVNSMITASVVSVSIAFVKNKLGA